MAPLIFLLASLALSAAFFALIEWEHARGARLFARERARFDEQIARVGYVAENVDWGRYLSEQIRALSLRLGHDLAHLALQLVRFVERLLARTLRQLRTRVAREAAPEAPTRPFVQALSDFKEELKTSRPDNIEEPPV
ncbi:MAG: hypothetical protein ACREGR_04425 [Minisyncoccia bacterium]